MAKRVLITGMSGLIGGLLKDHLLEAGGYELTALNRRSVDGVPTVQADIADLDAIQPAFEGQEVVVHLAAYLGSQDWEGQHAGNVLGTYNVFEASRRAGVKRVIFASSGNAIRGFERVPPYSHIAAGEYEKVPEDFRKLTHLDVRPEALYGAAKVWGEALARHFADDYDMSMVCVRIGSVTKENRPRTMRENAIYLSPNPPKDTDGRREDSERVVRELQGRWPGLHWGRWEVGGRSSVAAQGPYGRLRELRYAGWRENTQQGTLADRGGASLRGRWVSCRLTVRPGVEWLAAGPRRE